MTKLLDQALEVARGLPSTLRTRLPVSFFNLPAAMRPRL